jgi:hypothetical protein
VETVKPWWTALVGVAFVALFVVITILFGDGQDATKKTAQEVINHYKDNKTQETIGGLLVGVAAIVLLFWGGWLRRVLRAAEGEGGILSAVAFAGAIVFAGGAIVSGAIHLELADYSDNLEVVNPLVFQTLNAFEWNNFLFFPVGLGTLILASSISAIRHGSMPKWLAWVGIAIIIVSATPVGFIGFFGAPAWILVLSVLGAVRARRGREPVAVAS